MYECCADTSLSPTSQVRLSVLEHLGCSQQRDQGGGLVMILGREGHLNRMIAVNEQFSEVLGHSQGI